MKSVVLIPYCPLPVDTGAKVEMWKHLDLLRELGACTIVSAGERPVGAGWTAERRAEIERRGFKIVLREDSERALSWRQWAGMGYAALAKALRLEKAFGHSNPYHRNAFPEAWWHEQTRGADLAVINYSYWASLPCACPKAVALLDLWSDFMWEGPAREIKDLRTADLILVISQDEERKLKEWGLAATLWSPPCVAKQFAKDSDQVGLLGSGSPMNREGLAWLRQTPSPMSIHVYGALSTCARDSWFVARGPYADSAAPYQECGIILMPTALGMGVQIKGIEALAAGRCIVARRGAMRGLPVDGGHAWIEVDTPQQMIDEARRLQGDVQARQSLSSHARAYYDQYLDAERTKEQLRSAWLALVSSNPVRKI